MNHERAYDDDTTVEKNRELPLSFESGKILDIFIATNVKYEEGSFQKSRNTTKKRLH